MDRDLTTSGEEAEEAEIPMASDHIEDYGNRTVMPPVVIAMSSTGNPISARITQALRRIIHAVDRYSHLLSHHHAITGPQLACLIAVAESDGLTVSSLSKAIHLSPSTVVGILDRLEGRDLLTRRRSTGDRREVHIHATPTGRALIAEAPSPLQRAITRGLESMSDDEQEDLAQSIDRLVAMLDMPSLPKMTHHPSQKERIR